jgi:hypothetical protein
MRFQQGIPRRAARLSALRRFGMTPVITREVKDFAQIHFCLLPSAF